MSVQKVRFEVFTIIPSLVRIVFSPSFLILLSLSLGAHVRS